MEIWWLEQSSADVPAADDWLGPGEKLRLDAMRFPKRRADWRLGRWTAKRAVAAYLKVACDPEMLARIEIRSALSGAPEVFLDNRRPAEVSVSITHRANVAACAIAPPEITIGCDLELVEPRSDAFLADYFTAAEQAFVMRMPAAERVVFSNLLWSAKESALKVLKEGLRSDTRWVEVNLRETAAQMPLKGSTSASVDDTPLQVQDWHPLTVTHADRECLQGWWQSAGELVRTIVTVPPAGAPKVLPVVAR